MCCCSCLISALTDIDRPNYFSRSLFWTEPRARDKQQLLCGQSDARDGLREAFLPQPRGLRPALRVLEAPQGRLDRPNAA